MVTNVSHLLVSFDPGNTGRPRGVHGPQGEGAQLYVTYLGSKRAHGKGQGQVRARLLNRA